jgi:hypothetical protein
LRRRRVTRKCEREKDEANNKEKEKSPSWGLASERVVEIM